MADLHTNYYDDILSASMNGKKKFRLTYRNGTTEEVTIEDISEYDQYGSKFGAGDINKTNQAVNEKFDAEAVVDPMLTTEKGFAADAFLTGKELKKQEENLTASNGMPFKFGVNENGEYGHFVTDSEGADTFVPFSGKYRLQVIGALQNTNLGLNENSTWQEIIDGIYSLFPEMLDVLAYFGISSLSISGSSRNGAGQWHYKSSGKFDITHFNKLTYVLSLDSSASYGYANCILYYEGGSLELSAGSKSIDVSKCTGDAYFRVGQSQVYHSEGDWTSGGEAYLTTAKLYV